MSSSTGAPQRRVILFVGEGDFGLALAVARGLPHAEIIATGFDSEARLHEMYREAPRIVGALRSMSNVAAVLHNVDATKLHSDPQLFSIATTAPHAAVASPVAGTASAGATLAEEFTAADLEENTKRQVGAEAESVDAKSRSQLGVDIFTDICFTHPHLGAEDSSAHASLLAHFFHSTSRLLERKKGSKKQQQQQQQRREQQEDGGEEFDGIVGGSPTVEETLVHVTLADGQADAWQLINMAEKWLINI